MRRAVRGEGGAGGHSEPFDDRERADAHLVAGLRQKTPDAFASLHEKYAAGIYSLALRMVRHTSDAEDITQDVLIRAFERLPRERRVLLRPWLYRLTLNRCYDHFRATARRQPASDRAGRMRRRDSLGPAEGEPVSPLDLFEQAELSRLFEATLNDLTRRQRAALLLKDVHGLSLVEVADCLEVTPGSVEVLLARARRAFRASYEARCLAEGRPMPSSAKVIAMLPGLPLFALPPALASPPVGLPPLATPLGSPAPLVTPPVLVPPLSLAAGSGIGAVLGLPASVKSAVLIAAAAATMGTAEIAVTSADHRPPQRVASVAAVAVAAPVVSSPAAAVSGSPRARATGTPSSTPSPAPLVAASPDASPASTEVAEPGPQGSPLAITTPSASPEPAVTPTPVDTPTARATTTPSPDPSPPASPDPSPTGGATPSPTATP